MVIYNDLEPYNPFERGFIFSFGLRKDPDYDDIFDESDFSLDFIEEKEVNGKKKIVPTPVPFELCSKSSETLFSHHGLQDYNLYCFNWTELAKKAL